VQAYCVNGISIFTWVLVLASSENLVGVFMSYSTTCLHPVSSFLFHFCSLHIFVSIQSIRSALMNSERSWEWLVAKFCVASIFCRPVGLSSVGVDPIAFYPLQTYVLLFKFIMFVVSLSPWVLASTSDWLDIARYHATFSHFLLSHDFVEAQKIL
jgi:hypothetical protein